MFCYSKLLRSYVYPTSHFPSNMQFDLDDIDEAMQNVSGSSDSSPAPLRKKPSDNIPILLAPPPPPSLATTPAHHSNTLPSKEKEALGSEASPAKSLSGRSTYVHIPEFLGLVSRYWVCCELVWFA